MLDLRTPSGWFFTLLGLVLLALAFFDPGAHARLTDANVNLYTGFAMLAFGAIMLMLSRRQS